MLIRSPFRLLVASLAVLLLSAPGIVFAQETPDEEAAEEAPDPAQQAAEYYAEASEAYGAGNFERAAELLQRAYEHDPNLVYIYNQILAYYGLGDFERGLEVLDAHEEAMLEDGRFTDLDEIRSDFNDGLAEREQEEEPVEVEAPPETEDANILAWSLMGSGGVVFAGGLVFASGLLIGDTIDRLEGSTDDSGYQEIYGDGSLNRDDDLSTLRTHQTLSAVLLSAGVVLGATGGTFLWLGGRADSDPSASLRIEPYIGRDSAGAVFSGRF